MRYTISDDSGFLAIVDPDAYRGFVGTDWTLDDIFRHFQQEMGERHMLIWRTGLEHLWDVEATFLPTEETGFRIAIGSIKSSSGRLLLTNFESLTMAAQYQEVILPQPHEANQIVTLSPGLYDCRIIQISDPQSDAPFEEPVSFIYEIRSSKKMRDAWSGITWSEKPA